MEMDEPNKAPIDISLSFSSFGSNEAMSLQKDIASLISQPRQGNLTIGMQMVRFVRPSGCLALLATANLWHRVTGGNTLLVGIQPSVNAYLERADLFKVGRGLVLGIGASSHEPFSRSRNSQTMLEISPVSHIARQNEHDVGNITSRASQILHKRYGTDHTQLDNLINLTSEIAQNVLHAEQPGYVMMQSWMDAKDVERTVEISIIDFGIGIEQSLRNKGELPTSGSNDPIGGSAFLKHALLEGVSSMGEDRGMGLFTVDRLVRKWHGSLELRSYNSMLRVIGGEAIARDELPSLQGTQVTIAVRGEYGGEALAES